jgi:hypothetical protein
MSGTDGRKPCVGRWALPLTYSGRMSLSLPAHYRAAPFALQAEWVVEESDVRTATRALPGSRLGLFRWPVAFFIAYAGVGLADPRVGPAFTLGSAAVISSFWIILALGSRGSRIRNVARLSQQQRASRITIDGSRVRQESASGHAGEYPLSELTHARMSDAGVMLKVRDQVLFVPRRAFRGADEAWTAFVASIPARPWPTGLGFTLGLWAFAAAVAVYGFVK